MKKILLPTFLITALAPAVSITACAQPAEPEPEPEPEPNIVILDQYVLSFQKNDGGILTKSSQKYEEGQTYIFDISGVTSLEDWGDSFWLYPSKDGASIEENSFTADIISIYVNEENNTISKWYYRFGGDCVIIDNTISNPKIHNIKPADHIFIKLTIKTIKNEEYYFSLTGGSD